MPIPDPERSDELDTSPRRFRMTDPGFARPGRGADPSRSRAMGFAAPIASCPLSKTGVLLLTLMPFMAGGGAFAQVSASVDNPQCYENVGCPHKDPISHAQARELSCQNLWYVRNTIFHQRGYCFQTERGRAEFSNSRCRTNSIAELNLSPVERANVRILQDVERSKGCH